MPSSIQVCSHSVNRFTPISPTKYRYADEGCSIGLYSQDKNSKEIGQLAIALSKYTYFGNAVLSRSTITGRGNKAALDPLHYAYSKATYGLFSRTRTTMSSKTFGSDARSSLPMPAKVCGIASN